jgi:hypothetical protein
VTSALAVEKKRRAKHRDGDGKRQRDDEHADHAGGDQRAQALPEAGKELAELHRFSPLDPAEGDHEARDEYRPEQRLRDDADERDEGQHDHEERPDYEHADQQTPPLPKQRPGVGDPGPAVAGGHAASGGKEIAERDDGVVGDLRARCGVRIRAHLNSPRAIVVLAQPGSTLSSSARASSGVWRTERTTPGSSPAPGSQHASRRIPFGSKK